MHYLCHGWRKKLFSSRNPQVVLLTLVSPMCANSPDCFGIFVEFISHYLTRFHQTYRLSTHVGYEVVYSLGETSRNLCFKVLFAFAAYDNTTFRRNVWRQWSGDGTGGRNMALPRYKTMLKNCMYTRWSEPRYVTDKASEMLTCARTWFKMAQSRSRRMAHDRPSNQETPAGKETSLTWTDNFWHHEKNAPYPLAPVNTFWCHFLFRFQTWVDPMVKITSFWSPSRKEKFRLF